MVNHPEPNVLESRLKCALESTAVNKASGYNRIPVELLKTLKDDAIKVLHSVWHLIWKIQQWPQDWKRSILTPVPKKGSTTECANHGTIALSHASKDMLKILIARPQHYANQELRDVQAGFRKKEPEIKLPTFNGPQRKLGNSSKTSTSLSSTTPKPLTMWIIKKTVESS